MSYDMTFRGQLQFRTKKALAEALADIDDDCWEDSALARDDLACRGATLEVDCAVSCSADTLRTKVSLNPGRVFWVIGNLDFDSAGDIGTAADPVMINVTGSVTFTSPVNVYGAIYSQAPTWALSGGGLITGGAFAEGNINDAAAATTGIVFNTDILTRLRT